MWGIQYCVIPFNVYLWHLLLFSSLEELKMHFFWLLYLCRGVCKKVLSDFLVEILRNMIDLVYIEHHHIMLVVFKTLTVIG